MTSSIGKQKDYSELHDVFKNFFDNKITVNITSNQSGGGNQNASQGNHGLKDQMPSSIGKQKDYSKLHDVFKKFFDNNITVNITSETSKQSGSGSQSVHDNNIAVNDTSNNQSGGGNQTASQGNTDLDALIKNVTKKLDDDTKQKIKTIIEKIQNDTLFPDDTGVPRDTFERLIAKLQIIKKMHNDALSHNQPYTKSSPI